MPPTDFALPSFSLYPQLCNSVGMMSETIYARAHDRLFPPRTHRLMWLRPESPCRETLTASTLLTLAPVAVSLPPVDFVPASRGFCDWFSSLSRSPTLLCNGFASWRPSFSFHPASFRSNIPGFVPPRCLAQLCGVVGAAVSERGPLQGKKSGLESVHGWFTSSFVKCVSQRPTSSFRNRWIPGKEMSTWKYVVVF